MTWWNVPFPESRDCQCVSVWYPWELMAIRVLLVKGNSGNYNGLYNVLLLFIWNVICYLPTASTYLKDSETNVCMTVFFWDGRDIFQKNNAPSITAEKYFLECEQYSNDCEDHRTSKIAFSLSSYGMIDLYTIQNVSWSM